MLLSIFLLIAGSDEAVARARERSLKAEPVATCSVEHECSEKWLRAKEWVRSHSQFQIEVEEPDLLATYPPVYANTGLAFVITKRKSEDGRYDIAARAWCGNVLTCKPKPRKAIIELRAALR